MIWNLDCPEKSLALEDPVLRLWQVFPPLKYICLSLFFTKIKETLPEDKLAQN